MKKESTAMFEKNKKFLSDKLQMIHPVLTYKNEFEIEKCFAK